MDQVRVLLASIQKNLGALGATQKLLIGSLAVIMLMTLFLVSQYAGKQTYVPLLPGASSEDQQKAATVLRTANIGFQEGPTGILVPAEKREDAFALLGQSGNQPANSALVFENLLKNQNWMNSREQNRQLYKVMLDNWLSGVLSKFGGIRQASVFVDVPEPGGIGQSVKRAKASVTLFSDTGRAVPQETVDAAARFVSGSVAGLDLDSVVVNDATAGKGRKVTTDTELLPTTYREYASSVERDFKSKIESLLRFMDPPAVVEVTATVDVTRVHSQVSKTLPKGSGSETFPKKETTSSTSETQATAAAEPGLRSNAPLDINAGGAKGGKSEQKQEDIEYENRPGTRVDQIDDPRGHPTHLVATVMVPRAYIAGLIQREAPVKEGQKPEAPAPDRIAARFDEERKAIEASLKPHVNTRTPEGQAVLGEVVVTMVTGEVFATNTPGPGGVGGAGTSAGSPGGLAGALGTVLASGSSGMIDRIVLGALAVVALGMMLFMVRRTGRRTHIPLPQELAGRPPTLEAKSDLVGEADETETAMAGIEVGEEQIKADKMREQVSELVRQNPEGAAKLLNRWIAVEA
jgi:flagellar M-ring protein FliF